MFHCKIKLTLINQETSFANLQTISRWKRSKVSRTDPVVTQSVKNPTAMQESQVRSLGWEDPLEKEIATHSSTLAWKIPWTEEPGRLQSMGSQRVGHDSVTSLSLFKSFMVSGLMFKTSIHLVLTVSPAALQFSQHHWLKRLSAPHVYSQLFVIK